MKHLHYICDWNLSACFKSQLSSFSIKSVMGTAQATVTTSITNSNPVAVDDTGMAVSGQSVMVDVISNDNDPENDLDPRTVKIVGTAKVDDSLVVAGEGIWSVNPSTGTITFTPNTGFTGDSTPISYTVRDRTGLTSSPATVTVDYPQTAQPVAGNDGVMGISG